MTKKKQVGVRFDSNRTRLKTGETQRPNGTYAYRWSTPDGKRHSIYAPTLEKLREQEEQIIVDKHDGIRSDVKSITVNEMFDLWCQLKRGIKDSTFKNYIYMYELFVKPSFGKNRLVQVKKSDVRKFYNSLADGKVLKIATILTFRQAQSSIDCPKIVGAYATTYANLLRAYAKMRLEFCDCRQVPIDNDTFI